jgi:hypothetical protein
MIARLEEVTDGDVYNALYPHMSVFDNIAFGLKMGRMPADQIRARADEAARILQIGHLSAVSPSNFPAASDSVSRSGARSFAIPSYFCSTSRSPTSMRSCARRCASRSRSSTAISA